MLENFYDFNIFESFLEKELKSFNLINLLLFYQGSQSAYEMVQLLSLLMRWFLSKQCKIL